jgi:hypothetical protein
LYAVNPYVEAEATTRRKEAVKKEL